jgi:hypothetical protein
MMTFINQEKRIKKTKLYIIIGIVAVSFLVAAVIIRHRAGSQISHFNIPTGQYPTVPPSAPAYTVVVHSLGYSGVTGTATFEDVSGALAIRLHIDGLEEDSLAAIELHYGACATSGPLAYVLVTPDAEESETDLSINLKQFNAQKPMAVILYRSTQDRTAIACGDLP